MNLTTFGYGMTAPTKRPKAEIFKECLEAAQIDLLIDTRFSLWGGY